MTVAKGYTNFNWQLRMLKQQTDCCGGQPAIPSLCYCSTIDSPFDPDALINSISGTDPSGTPFVIVAGISLWLPNFDTDLKTIIDAQLGSNVIVTLTHITDTRWRLCINNLPQGYTFTTWEISIGGGTDDLIFSQADNCDLIPGRAFLEMEFFSEFGEPFSSMVDPTDVTEWNAFYGFSCTNVTVLPPNPFTGRTTVYLYGAVYRGTQLLAADFAGDNVYMIADGGEFIATVEASCFNGLQIEVFTSTYLPVIENNTFRTSRLTIINCPNTVTIQNDAFNSTFLLATYNFPSVTSIGANAFENTYGLLNIIFEEAVTIDSSAFAYTLGDNLNITEILLPACTTLGPTVGDDSVFSGIIGSTISATFNSSLATNNAGNPDGDIQYLEANDTITITYV